MKYWKKLGSVLLALVMVMALAAPAFAANPEHDSAKGGEGSITISNANEGQTYTVWRVFEASVDANNHERVVYKLLAGKTLPEDNGYFVQDAQGLITATEAAVAEGGGLSTDAIEWLTANYKSLGEEITSVTPGEAGVQKITGLQLGYYYVTTTSGTAVSVDTTNMNADITDKNPGTDIEKEIYAVNGGVITDPSQLDEHGKNALAQVGTTVGYEVRIPIANGAVNYVFTDTMSTGLTYDSSSLEVYLVDKDEEVAEGATGAAGYGTASTTDDFTIKIEFDNGWLKENTGMDIIIRYSAVVNTDAVIAGEGNSNTASIKWGNGDNTFTDEDEAKVYSAKITVIKTDGDGEPLAGAGFILKNSDDKYYTWDEDKGVVWVEDEADAQEIMVEEVTEGEGDDETTEMQAVFNGLCNGEYTLIEKTVPAGYNKAGDITITITDDSVEIDNIAQSQTVMNLAGSLLPSTGGIGTTIFYVVGGVLVVGAVVLLITKRRTSVDDE